MRTKTHYIVGLTGGIGAGKTTVTDLFSSYGAKVIDADVVSRQLLEKGSPTLNTVINHFGQHYLDVDGNLDRALLRRTVFSNKQEKLWLEETLHPLIRNKINSLINSSTADYVILSVPLLLESQQFNFVDQILVIDCPPELQISRAMLRDKTTVTDIKKILQAQMSRKERLSYADDIITNDSTIEDLTQQVLALHEKYRQKTS